MPVHQTISPVEAVAKSLDALLTSIESPPSAAAIVAFKAAIRRHGANLHDQAGPEGLAEALARIRTDAADRAQAEERERIVLEAWADLLAQAERAA